MELALARFVPRSEVIASRPARAEAVRFTGLWLVGTLAGLERRTVAIVGTRAPSEAGRERSRLLARGLAEAGVCVVSGLALGIDGAAHEGALQGRGPTIGILGGGHGHFFPRRNRELAERIVAAGGAVLSPYPPGEPARPFQFLQRNGVVAALADAVVVVEAAERSGALNTASWASELGIDVLAFPGDVDRPKCAGTNGLIRDGATLVRHAGDVLEALGIARDPITTDKRSARPYDVLERELLRALAAEPLSLDALLERTADALLERTASGASQVIGALARLELEGVVERRSDSLEYALRAGGAGRRGPREMSASRSPTNVARMKIRLLAVGKLRERYLAAAAADFTTRLRRYGTFEELEVAASFGGEPERAKREEGERLLRALAPAEPFWLLERTGTQLSSPELAEKLRGLADVGTAQLTVGIAGTYGASAALLERADFRWSLSALTFLHEWARAIVLEQLYRAAKIARNEPYHH